MENTNNPATIKAEEKKKEGRRFCFTTETAKEVQQSALVSKNGLIDGIITPGLNILAAPRKKGKSWLALDMALSVAGKNDFWGRKTEHGKVLFFALEDHKNRMKQRIDTILDDDDAPEDLIISYSAGATGNIFYKDLDAFLKENTDIKLVIIDVLQKIRPDKKSGQTEYAHDYDDIGKLKDIALKHNISLLVVTHTRKTRDPFDKLNEISGGTGVTAAADTILMISNRKPNEKENTLSIIGRDVPETELSVVFDSNCCRWKNMGTTEELNIKKDEELYAASPIVKAIKILLDRNNGKWEGTSRELLDFGAKEFGQPIAKSESALARKINKFDNLFEKDCILHTKPNPNGGIAGRKHIFVIFDKERDPISTCSENPSKKIISMSDMIQTISVTL